VTREKPAVTQDRKADRFADCGDEHSPAVEFQHQVRPVSTEVSTGAALRFSLFCGTFSVLSSTSPRASWLGYDDSDLAFVGRIQHPVSWAGTH
jgi:hypothetical protein